MTRKGRRLNSLFALDGQTAPRKRDALRELCRRVFCPQCGAVRVCPPGSPNAICPNGHGKLVPRFNKADLRKALVAAVPKARRVGCNRFSIDGRKGLFQYRNGSGRRPAHPDTPVGPDEVLARHVTAKRQLVRVFARAHPRRRKDA